MTRLGRFADRLAVGSRAYARRLAAGIAAWCAQGRREDLPGWRGTLGVHLRIALLILGVYVVARIVRSVPSLMWLGTGWWTLASWRAGRPSPDTSEEALAPPNVEAVRHLLLTLMGTSHGVHLRTVLTHLQEHGQWEGRTVSDLRVHLERLGITVHPKVKVAGTPTRGVRREDLETPSPAEAQETSPSPSTAA